MNYFWRSGEVKEVKKYVFKYITSGMEHSWRITLIAGFFLVNTVCPLAQNRRTLSIDGGLYANSNNDVAAHVSVSRNWLFSPYFGVSAGAMLLFATLDDAGWSTKEQTVRYSIDEKKVQHLNIVLSAFYMRPLVRNTGIYGNGSILFEPVPFDYISIEKWTGNDPISENRGKFQYSGFSPGAFAEAGLFHDFKKRNKGFRLFIGFGYGWYDMYAAYRRTTIDGQKLSFHVPSDNYYKRITVKLMGL
jgi:hypothetical protein